ncbi:TPA: hypothetical protein DCE37_17525 [Candidatus Latescibacteria bacterium]|nr:hypothetical protein [Candidatus Latescibacterota bacterium]
MTTRWASQGVGTALAFDDVAAVQAADGGQVLVEGQIKNPKRKSLTAEDAEEAEKDKSSGHY